MRSVGHRPCGIGLTQVDLRKVSNDGYGGQYGDDSPASGNFAKGGRVLENGSWAEWLTVLYWFFLMVQEICGGTCWCHWGRRRIAGDHLFSCER